MVVGSIVLLIESSLTFSVCCVVLSLFLLPDVDDDDDDDPLFDVVAGVVEPPNTIDASGF